MILDELYRILDAGGAVMLPIFLVGAWGFYLLLSTYAELRSDVYRRNPRALIRRVQSLLDRGDLRGAESLVRERRGLLAACLALALENRHLTEAALRNLLEERLGRLVLPLDRRLPMVAVLATAAPLLGLLGTVSGMMHTFEVITVHGNRNPVLLADGISEALITTQSGLLIAFPLLLLRHRLQERIGWLGSQVELGLTSVLNQLYHRHPPLSSRS